MKVVLDTGVYENLHFSEYLMIDAVNFSSLKHIDISPLKYQYEKDNTQEDKSFYQLGRAVHTAVLEPETLNNEVIVYDLTKTKRGAKWDAFKELHAGKNILTVSEYDQMEKMTKGVKRYSSANFTLKKGKSEVTMIWMDPILERLCKCRIDWLGEKFFTDLKTTASDTVHKFNNDFAKYKYHAQMAFYQRGIYQTTGELLPCNLIVSQKNAPFDCFIANVGDEVIRQGNIVVEKMLNSLKNCYGSKRFCGLGDKLHEVALPNWAIADSIDIEEFDIEGLGDDFENKVRSGLNAK
ncbi:MAG: hypothetical protein DRQ41_15415 [Gammaproteobacteria bacterium]|nr:MAG: hypothetical protein DRQ41_15415 [Gammaproteobacteria bacterium]